MDLVDLFSGGGGSSTGYHMAGFETKVAIDHELHCVNTFKLNHGNVVYQKDISTLHSNFILEKLKSKPAVVTASPPCEPYTSANEKRIKNPFERMFIDPIGRLMIDAIRLIADIDPEFYTIENVTGILDGDSKDLLRDEFDRVGLGKPYFNVIEAEEWGVPSKRTRVIISNIRINSPRKRKITVMEAIGDLPPPNYPHEYEYHYTIPISTKRASKIPLLSYGEGLVYFPGANNEYKNYMRLHPDRVAPVIMGKSRFIHPYEDRLLTPAEHARLMTFPDTYKYWGNSEQIYDVIGEAVPPKVTYEIGKQFIKKL